MKVRLRMKDGTVRDFGFTGEKMDEVAKIRYSATHFTMIPVAGEMVAVPRRDIEDIEIVEERK